MRLERRGIQHEPEPLLVGVVSPPVLPAAAGLEELFRDFYSRLHPVALDHAERHLSREEARDAVSDAELKLWRLWPHLRPEQRTDAYYMSAVRSKVRDALEQAGRFVSIEDVEPEFDGFVSEPDSGPVLDDERARILDEALAAMPARRREVLLLIHEHRLSWKEAAEELGLSLGTINTHMLRAAKQLRAAFTRAGFRVAAPRPRQLPADTGDATHD